MSLLPLEPGPWQCELDQQGMDLLMTDRMSRSHRHADKKDWFSPEQWELRHAREIHSLSGVEIDRMFFSGVYSRAWNPMTGTRPVSQGRYSKNQDPWGQDWWDSFDDLPPGVPLPSLYRGDRFVESGSHYCWDIMLPNRVTVTVLDVEVFPADRQVWECPDCTCDNYLDPGGLPEPCSYCGAEVELL